MKEIVFQTIGTCERITGDGLGNQMKVILSGELKQALHNLNHFSHCILYTRTDEKIHSYSFEILDIHEKIGEMNLVAAGSPERVEGDLVDIKPYFPCEEVAEHPVLQPMEHPLKQPCPDSVRDVSLPFTGSPIGEYLFVQHQGRIQFQETESMHANALSEAIGNMRPGDYLRIIWWFHRFDEKKYRSHVMCNPPYDNAPTCGVFATRSPVRPNPLASTLVKVVEADPQHHWISVLGFDGFEYSVVLQVMPYRESHLEEVRVPKWVSHWTQYKVFHDHTTNQMLTEADAVNQMKTEYDAANSMKTEYDPAKNLAKTEHADAPAGEVEDWCEELDGEDPMEQDAYDANAIVVENASIHNLKGITVSIPKEAITVIVGVSGSGKSSLAFDTIYHESQKQFIDLVASNSPIGTDLKDSKVKRIAGLQPSIAIEQKNLGTNPRSTVASVSRIGDFLRLLYATMGERFCPVCGQPVPKDNVCAGCGAIFFSMTPALFNYNHPEYMCPVCKGLGEEYQFDIDLIVPRKDLSILDGASDWWGNLRKHHEKPNANWMKGEVLALAEEMQEDLEVPYHALSDAFRQQVMYGSGGREVTLRYENPNGRSGAITRPVEGVIHILNRLLAENRADKSMDHIERYMVRKTCSRCHGERLLEEGRLVRIGNTRYPVAARMSITELEKWCRATYRQLDAAERETCRPILSKIVGRLRKLEQVGLGYLTPDRSIPTLSGGEAQRLKIAAQFGTGLSNILYIMDEPSKGLHPKDYQFLIGAIQELKRQKNTIIIVEHKKEFEQMADYIIEMGPGAGHYGGQLMRAEPTAQAMRSEDAPGHIWMYLAAMWLCKTRGECISGLSSKASAQTT